MMHNLLTKSTQLLTMGNPLYKEATVITVMGFIGAAAAW